METTKKKYSSLYKIITTLAMFSTLFLAFATYIPQARCYQVGNIANDSISIINAFQVLIAMFTVPFNAFLFFSNMLNVLLYLGYFIFIHIFLIKSIIYFMKTISSQKDYNYRCVEMLSHSFILTIVFLIATNMIIATSIHFLLYIILAVVTILYLIILIIYCFTESNKAEEMEKSESLKQGSFIATRRINSVRLVINFLLICSALLIISLNADMSYIMQLFTKYFWEADFLTDNEITQNVFNCIVFPLVNIGIITILIVILRNYTLDLNRDKEMRKGSIALLLVQLSLIFLVFTFNYFYHVNFVYAKFQAIILFMAIYGICEPTIFNFFVKERKKVTVVPTTDDIDKKMEE